MVCLVLGLSGLAAAQPGTVKFQATVTAEEQPDAAASPGTWFVAVRVDQILQDDRELLPGVNSVEVCYAKPAGLRPGDRVEVRGTYYKGTSDCPAPYCGRVVAFADPPYVKRLVTQDLYVLTRDGILKVSPTGESQLWTGKHTSSYALEIQNNTLYVAGGGIVAYDLQGGAGKTIPRPPQTTYLTFVVLPDDRFALLNNETDKVYFADSQGTLLATVNLRDTADNSLQNIDGVVVGNRLAVAEDGGGRVFQIDLATYGASVLKDLSDLGAGIWSIDYADGKYYVGLSTGRLYSFTASGSAVPVATIPGGGGITGVVVVENSAYVVTNYPGKVCRVDLTDGTVTTILSNLNMPRDIEVAGATTPVAAVETLPAPAYDSGWVEMTAPRQNKVLTHGLGGSLDAYKIDLTLRRNNIAGTEYLTNEGIGQDFYYTDLTTQSVRVVGPQALGADYQAWLRVRIWLHAGRP
jgi:hypothetical protein